MSDAPNAPFCSIGIREEVSQNFRGCLPPATQEMSGVALHILDRQGATLLSSVDEPVDEMFRIPPGWLSTRRYARGQPDLRILCTPRENSRSRQFAKRPMSSFS